MSRKNVKSAGSQILEAFADTYPRAVFVEIGANDGVNSDHLTSFITASEWRGVLVEPLPWVFERLRSNYEGFDGLAFENAAVGDTDGRVPFFYVPPDQGKEVLGDNWQDLIGSLSRFEVEQSVTRFHNGFNVAAPDVEIQSTEVPSLTFESLCRKHGIEELDLLMIDAQGYDFKIVKGIDFERHRPRLLIFETILLNGDERREAKAYVERLGYETMDEHADTWCHDPRDEDDLARCWRSAKPVQFQMNPGILQRLRSRLSGR